MKKYDYIVKLVLLVVILPIGVWQLALSKTYYLWREVEDKTQQLLALEIKPISNSNKEKIATQDITIVDYITNKLKIGVDRYNSYVFSLNDIDYDIVTHEVRMVGKYNNLVKGINAIEESGWTIFSQTFDTVIDTRTKQEVLNLTIIVKEIKERGGSNEE